MTGPTEGQRPQWRTRPPQRLSPEDISGSGRRRSSSPAAARGSKKARGSRWQSPVGPDEGLSGAAMEGTRPERSTRRPGPAGLQAHPPGVDLRDAGCNFCVLRLVVWIIGHSFMFWAKRRAAARPDGQHLGFSKAHLEVKWFGFRGFGWGDVFSELIHLLNRGRRPDVGLIPAGGDDLGLVPQRVLVRTMKQDINWLRDWLPGVAVVWSEIVPRFQWRHARGQVALGKCRSKINRLMSAFVRRMGGVAVRHRELEAHLPGYYRADGVHLSDIGTDFLNMGFQSRLERTLFMTEPRRLKVSRTGVLNFSKYEQEMEQPMGRHPHNSDLQKSIPTNDDTGDEWVAA
ncbi:uncharacterized protein RCH25_018195 [Pelodytes ibericus]